jgi:Glycosyltransferase sugar-binding region containing DXD motif
MRSRIPLHTSSFGARCLVGSFSRALTMNVFSGTSVKRSTSRDRISTDNGFRRSSSRPPNIAARCRSSSNTGAGHSKSITPPSCLLWEATDDRRFIEARYLSFLTRYDSYPQERYRLDIIRSFFLYSYGGFYAHMDSECLKPLKDFLHAGDVLLGRMGQDDDFEQSITNSLPGRNDRSNPAQRRSQLLYDP